MAFISKSAPTQEQDKLALEAGFELVPVGDCDGFDRAALIKDYKAACCVHAGGALHIACIRGLIIGVFDSNRLHVWTVNAYDVALFSCYFEALPHEN